MSSNNNHSNLVLTRANYEEMFLLYVDDELTAEQKKAVDDFAQQHPDLKEELDLLCSTKLPAEDLAFAFKNELLAESMKVNAVDESLLLYIDNELPSAEAANVAAQLKSDETLALQHNLLLKTKLDKTEIIPYPNKKELYRRTERRIAPVWLRIAAAVLVLASGTAVWMNSSDSKPDGAPVAVSTPQKTTPAIEPEQQPLPTPVAEEKQTVAVAQTPPAVKKAGTSIKTHVVQENAVAVVKRSVKNNSKPTFSNTHTAPEESIVVASNHLPTAKTDAQNLQPEATIDLQKKLGNPAVTSKTLPTYVTTDATAKTSVPVHAGGIETENEKSGGSVKGFLRKATRFIERRTGIKTVNDDNELLVGAVALKL